MIKKKLITGIVGISLVSLVGCAYNNDTALNERENRPGTLNVRDNDDRTMFNRDRDRDRGTGIFNWDDDDRTIFNNRRGPNLFTDDDDRTIFNRDRDRGTGIFNRDDENRTIFNRDSDRNRGTGIFNRDNDDRTIFNNRRGSNLFTDDANRNDGIDISSDSTTTPSTKFPHTKAVLIQEAKFKHIKMDPNQQAQLRDQLQQQITARLQKHGITVPQQGQAAAPAPQQQTQQQTQQPQAEAPKQAAPAPTSSSVNQAVAKVIELTNAERKKHGLPALQTDTNLNKVAQTKSVDMKQNNYFSHTSPTYGSPFDMMRDFGISYKTAGENIAQGQQTPEQVVDSWMKSQGHRENILSAKYTHIGVGYEPSGHHWTQMFIGK